MVLRTDIPLYPGGKTKAFTLSYDDGVVQDIRLAGLLRRYGLQATFNLNSGTFGQVDQYSHLKVKHEKVNKEQVRELYQDFEVACQTVTHPDLASVPEEMISYEIACDKRNLENITGRIVTGLAYPYGTYSKITLETARRCGIRYARTIRSTESFKLPEDFLVWNPTCHHSNPGLLKLAEQFIGLGSDKRRPLPVFYVWGHAYEFDNDDCWNLIEELFQLISGREDIWYATNGQIEEYVSAWRQLRYSSDGSLIYNPTALDIWIRVVDEVYEIPSGRTAEITPAWKL